MKLPQSIRRQIVSHALGSSPREACGLIARESEGTAPSYFCLPARNIAEASDRFEMDPRDQLRIYEDAERAGHQVIAVYHSHVSEPAFPSTEDIRLAAYPNLIYLICALGRDGEGPEIRGFRIEGTRVTEVELTD